ncbi:hypothetical protein [Deminuibacter soli]|uniref:Uncharacterized protein n=1 Tax=Deminuibacter soli TaxID=2291815 RepID=A0A3E1NEZ2_9BACT|nr:hypothetical protein [Deminuibacter soli]RFM26555.1 hypothetical protein DXN05_18430 [Deminuibacter soli]
MKKGYYVSKVAQDNGDHEVHAEDCAWLPKPTHRTYLGQFDNCADAVREAKKYHNQANGCIYCSKPCHTQ